THQSGRSSSIEAMRVWPQEGNHFVFLTTRSARERPPLASIRTNHCSVARKITGFLQRQQHGYSWVIGSARTSVPRARSASAILGFASKTRWPFHSFASSVKYPP